LQLLHQLLHFNVLKLIIRTFNSDQFLFIEFLVTQNKSVNEGKMLLIGIHTFQQQYIIK